MWKWFLRKRAKSLRKKAIERLEKDLNSIKKTTILSPNELIKSQLENPDTIPVIIINFNQLEYLKDLIHFLEDKKTINIIIIDNNSTYLPLLKYYDEIADNIVIHRQKDNLGHLVFWKNRELFHKYANGFFIVTDADIVPNTSLPTNYLKRMLDLLYKYKEITKIGFALKIDDIPNEYPLKDKVLNWEKKFWTTPLEKDVYQSDIDTTFALYWPGTDRFTEYLYPSFFNAIRLAGDYTAQHGGWYLKSNELTEEQKFYYKHANVSNSWKIDEKGNLIGDFKDSY